MIFFVSIIVACVLPSLLASAFVPHYHQRWDSSQLVTPGHVFTVRTKSTRVGMIDPNDPASELTSTLARLDQQWKIQERSRPTSRWTKLVLSSPTDTENNKENVKTDSVSSSSSSSENVQGMAPESPLISQEDFVYLLEPPNKTIPSCLITFTGGAGLGTYPQIAYNEFLLRLSNRLNAAVITAPYNVGLDHFSIAKETGELTRRAIIRCQDERMYPKRLPLYSLSHSLGSKLSCIYAAATGQNFDGIGLISFNNFGFSKTIGMAKNFAETIRQNSGMSSLNRGVSDEVLNSIFSFAEMAVSAVGIDFSPTQADMDRLIRLRYNPELQRKTRLFTFDKDVLENTLDFVTVCEDENINSGLTVSGLPGTHLTPVYFKLGLDDIPDEVTRGLAREAAGNFENVSFGDEKELQILVDEVTDWILGRAPSRKPEWLRERPQLSEGTAEVS